MCLQFLTHEQWIIIVLTSQGGCRCVIEFKLNELIDVKLLAQCLAHNKHDKTYYERVYIGEGKGTLDKVA